MKYINIDDINVVLNNININNSKPSYLPRFSKVYKQLNIENYKFEQSELEKEYSLFYLLKLLYEFGFDEKITEQYVVDSINSQIEVLKEDENSSVLENAKLVIEKGLYKYKQDEIISKNGDAEKLRRFEKFYAKVVAKLFEIVLENLKLDKELVQENALESTEDIEIGIKKTLNDMIQIEEYQTENLFISSIYATAKLGDISTMSAFKQAIDRYITLFTSLKDKYKCYNDVLDNINKKILEKDGILDSSDNSTDIISELEKLQKQLNIEVKLFDYENNKLNTSEKTELNEDLEKNILRAFNINEQKEYFKLEDIKYDKQAKDGNSVPVALWQSGKSERGSDRIINSKFIILENKQRTLNYLIDSHIHAMDTAGLKYNKIFDDIKTFNTRTSKENRAYYADTCNILNISAEALDELNKKNYIEYLMTIKSKIFAFYKENKEDELEDELKVELKNKKDKLYTSLSKINDEVNKYNFYFKLITLTQLQQNKKFLQSLNTRCFAWLYQGEKTGAYLLWSEDKNKQSDKKQKLDKLGNYVEFINKEDKKEFDKFERDAVAHLNLVQDWHEKNNQDKKSPKQIYESFNAFNKYETKKLNEVVKLEHEILGKFNLAFNATKTKFIPKEKTIKAVKKQLNNISQEEADYMNAIYNFQRKKSSN